MVGGPAMVGRPGGQQKMAPGRRAAGPPTILWLGILLDILLGILLDLLLDLGVVVVVVFHFWPGSLGHTCSTRRSGCLLGKPRNNVKLINGRVNKLMDLRGMSDGRRDSLIHLGNLIRCNGLMKQLTDKCISMEIVWCIGWNGSCWKPWTLRNIHELAHLALETMNSWIGSPVRHWPCPIFSFTW